MSSVSYPTSEGWNMCKGFLESASAHVLHLPSITSRVFQMEVMNWVSRRFWNGGSTLERVLSMSTKVCVTEVHMEYKEYGRDGSMESMEGRLGCIRMEVESSRARQIWVWYLNAETYMTVMTQGTYILKETEVRDAWRTKTITWKEHQKETGGCDRSYSNQGVQQEFLGAIRNNKKQDLLNEIFGDKVEQAHEVWTESSGEFWKYQKCAEVCEEICWLWAWVFLPRIMSAKLEWVLWNVTNLVGVEPS